MWRELKKSIENCECSAVNEATKEWKKKSRVWRLEKKKEISIQSKWETRLQLVKVSIVLGTFRSSKTRVLLRK